jgi:pSer/pThr/pTyr-binding forkhead associated (FHA) protein
LISIVFTEGPRAGERVDVDRDLTVGRSEGDIVLSDHQVSRRHLALRPAGSDLHVEDLGSSNGTFVNGYRIDQPVSAADGDVVQIGSSELIVQASTPEEEPASPAAPAADSSAAEIPPRDRPTALWLATGLVEIAVILTAATLLVYYAVR